MRLLYQLGIRIFLLLVRIKARRDSKAKQWIEGRKGLMKRIENSVRGIENSVWIHCASLGEFEQGRPLIEAIKERTPEQTIVLTFFSPSGYEVRKDYDQADYVFYLPADTRKNARRMVKALRPRAVFFIKYEYWFNILRRLKKEKIPVYFISAIFRKNQIFFKWYGKWYRKLPAMATHLFVQNQESVDLLNSIGIKQTSIAGDTRFDRVARVVKTARPLPGVEKFLNGQKALIAGSSWKAEEAMVMQFIRNRSDLKVIIAPHEIDQDNIARILKLFGDKAMLYSQISKADLCAKQVLIIDCYGLLVSLYQYGKIALIGGGFGVGIHNILEAASFGMPVLFGPNYERFKEAVDMIDLKCAFPVHNIEEFNTILNHLLMNDVLRNSLSQKASEYVFDHVGSTNRILDQVF